MYELRFTNYDFKRKGIFALGLLLFFFVNGNAQQKTVDGPQSTFDTPELIDTITLADLDTLTWAIKGDNRYVFWFTNTGTMPLVVEQSRGSDPDYNCDYTKGPIRPGGRGSVTICAYPQRFTMDKRYFINDNSVLQQTIRIKRVMQLDDSLSKVLYGRYNARMELARLAYENKKAVAPKQKPLYRFYRDSVPEELKPAFAKSVPVFYMDTVASYLKISMNDSVPQYTLGKKSERPVRPGVVLEIQKALTYYYYDANLQLVYAEELLPMQKEIYRCTEYKNGKPVKTWQRVE